MTKKDQSAAEDKRDQSHKTTLVRGLRPKLFDGLKPSELTAVLAAAKELKFGPGQVLQREGDTASHLCLLVTGHAAFHKTTPLGGKLLIRWISAGDAFGLPALLQLEKPFVVTIQTYAGGSLLMWDRASAHALASRIPRLIENTYATLGDYATNLAEALSDRLSQTAQQRLARVLVESAHEIGRSEQNGIEIGLTNEQLAQMADVSMFTASRQLSEWQNQGILVKSRCKILLRTPETLVALL